MVDGSALLVTNCYSHFKRVTKNRAGLMPGTPISATVQAIIATPVPMANTGQLEVFFPATRLTRTPPELALSSREERVAPNTL
jgi:hypothetical protein